MTVCSLLFSNQIPIVITDSLISSDSNISLNGIDTPINFDENRVRELENKIYYPIGIANKIWKLTYDNNTIYMLYAGDVSSAHQFAKTISSFNYEALIKCIETERLEEELKNQNYLPKNIAVILIYLDSKGYVSNWHYNCDYYEKLKDYSMSIGSGSKLFQDGFKKLFCDAIKSENNLTAAFSELNKDNLDDPEFHNALEKNLEGKILFSLNLLAIMTKDLLERESSFLNTSCGGLFNIFFLPELYQIPQEEHSVFTSPVCQFFIKKENNNYYLEKLVITSRGDFFRSLVSKESLSLTSFNNIKIKKNLLKVYNIKDIYKLSSIDSKINAVDDMKINHLILYIYDNKKRTHTIHSTLHSDGVMKINSHGDDIELIFEQDFIAQIISRFK